MIPMLRRLALVAVLVTAVLAAVWSSRRPLTAVTLRGYLAAQGVEAGGTIVALDGDHVELRDVRLGPAARPDLTARRIVVGLGRLPWQPRVTSIRLAGGELRVDARGPGLRFGSLDRLILPGRSTRLPAVAVDTDDLRVLIATAAGPVVAHASGHGRLDRDFAAVVRTDAAMLRRDDCAVASGPATMRIAVRGDRFTASGAGALRTIDCRRVRAPGADWQATIGGPVSLATLAGHATLRAAALDRGSLQVEGPVRLDADVVGDTGWHGRWTAAAAALRQGGDRAAAVRATGRFTAAPGKAVAATGTLAATVVSDTLRAQVARAAFPPELAMVTRIAAAPIALSARFSVGESAVVDALALDGVDGARLRFAGALRSGATPIVDGTLDVGGGGLPTVHARLNALTGRSGSAVFAVAPWSRGGAQLAVRDGRLTVGATQLALGGDIALSVRRAGLQLDGLTVPLRVRVDRELRRITLGNGCTPVAFRALALGTARVGGTALTLCPAAGTALATVAAGAVRAAVDIAPFRAQVAAAGSSYVVDVQPARITLAPTPAGLAIATPALTVAAASAGLHGRLTVAGRAERSASGWSGSGRMTDATLTTGALRADGGRARWRWAGDAVRIDDAHVVLTDPGLAPRFAPLRLTGVAATVSGDTVAGTGQVRLAAGDAPLGTVSARYDISARRGSAQVGVGVTFAEHLQPLDLSDLARGAVANVRGRLDAVVDATIDGDRLAATATVTAHRIELATAALGPVTGIDGTVRFTDLPALQTAPGQQLRIGSVNPGVLVERGTVTFQLLGADAARLEHVAFAFAGGSLTLQPVTLRTGEPVRRFTLTVDGLDAEQFLQRFEIKNLYATGRFDGVLPLTFTRSVGHIDDGVLTARAGGGRLQYVGEVGQASMGTAGRLAFDALRQFRYQSLVLHLGGDLDGELVSAADFSGVSEAPLRASGGLPIRAPRLPFHFGLTVRAPFRSLLGTAASFDDARLILHEGAPAR